MIFHFITVPRHSSLLKVIKNDKNGLIQLTTFKTQFILTWSIITSDWFNLCLAEHSQSEASIIKKKEFANMIFDIWRVFFRKYLTFRILCRVHIFIALVQQKFATWMSLNEYLFFPSKFSISISLSLSV